MKRFPQAELPAYPDVVWASMCCNGPTGKNTCHNPPEVNVPCLAFLLPDITSPLCTEGIAVAPEGWKCAGEVRNTRKRFPREQIWALVGKPVYRLACSSLEVRRECNCTPLSGSLPKRRGHETEWVAERDSRDLSLLLDLRQKQKMRASKSLPPFFFPLLIVCLLHSEIISNYVCVQCRRGPCSPLPNTA